MPVTFTEEDRVLTANLAGEVDHHGAKAIMTGLDDRISLALPRRLILDLSAVTFLDSSGIAIVLRAHRRLAELGGALTVRNVPAQPMKVLKAASLERLVTFE